MNINEAATLLRWSRDEVKSAIAIGVTPHGASQPIKLQAEKRKKDFEISDEDLEAFVDAFERHEPGRHPPIATRRALFIEARENCCICGESGPFEFHHILDWARLKHHDPQHMMLLCRNCHGKCTSGLIDVSRQREYKTLPRWKALFVPPPPGHTIVWSDLRDVISQVHEQMESRGDGTPGRDYDYVEIARKNEINRLTEDSYNVWRQSYEPKFFSIEKFLGEPRNADLQQIYLEIVGDLRAAIAARQGREPEISFDAVLHEVFAAAFETFSTGPRVNRETLRALVAFMYFNCDIGRKTC